jgi:hypothetical protein
MRERVRVGMVKIAPHARICADLCHFRTVSEAGLDAVAGVVA